MSPMIEAIQRILEESFTDGETTPLNFAMRGTEERVVVLIDVTHDGKDKAHVIEVVGPKPNDEGDTGGWMRSGYDAWWRTLAVVDLG